MHGWGWPAAVLGVIVFLSTAYKAFPGAWSFVKAAGKAPQAVEDLAKIANIADAVLAEFTPNGGGSMRDAIDRLETLIVERTQVIREGATSPEDLSDYTQDRMHDVLGKMTPLIGFMPVVAKRLERIEARLEQIEPVTPPEDPTKEN